MSDYKACTAYIEDYRKKKKPSQELIYLIRDIGSSIRNARNLIEKMHKKGRDEGFNEFEVTLLARELLRPSLTRRQMNYWFPVRSNAKRIQIAQEVHNVEDKDKVQFSETFIPPTTNLITSALTNQGETPNSKEIDRGKSPKTNSYSDLSETKSLNRSIYFGEYNNSTNSLFQVNRDCDFVKEHFKPRIDPIEAIEYLQLFVGKCQKIDFAFRVVE